MVVVAHCSFCNLLFRLAGLFIRLYGVYDSLTSVSSVRALISCAHVYFLLSSYYKTDTMRVRA